VQRVNTAAGGGSLNARVHRQPPASRHPLFAQGHIDARTRGLTAVQEMPRARMAHAGTLVLGRMSGHLRVRPCAPAGEPTASITIVAAATVSTAHRLIRLSVP